jgi:Protein of unknown function (DUF4242)
MALFLIERNFAEQLEFSAEGDSKVIRINEDVGVRWVYSFLSADKKKTYCIYEAPNVEAILKAARLAGVPADVIIEVSQHIPEQMLRPGAPA